VAIRAPRRIFVGSTSGRNNSSPGVVRQTLAAGLVGALAGAFLVLMAAPSDLFGRVPPPSGLIAAEPFRVAVVDGDTLRLDETIVRLQGVAAPPRGRICRRLDGTTFDCGAAAAAALAGMVRGHKVICRISARDANGVPEAFCEANSVQLNRALVAGGFAHARADAPVFGSEEALARAETRGLWRAGVTF
jgi:endonuclease YncB( thermonuclease family)